MNKKLFLKIAIGVLIILIVGTIWRLWLIKKPVQQFEQIKQTEEVPTTTEQLPPVAEIDGLENYSDASVEFKYPPVLEAKQKDGDVAITHSVVYKHTEPCDFIGDAPVKEKIYDFGVYVSVLDANLKDAIIKNEHSDFFVKEFFENNTLKLAEGYVDPISAGTLNGFQITNGVEGCGQFTYYFPVSSAKTLVINRPFITELSGVVGNLETYLNLPGIIAPEKEKEFFNTILSTLKVK